jgi:hypothetical protein
MQLITAPHDPRVRGRVGVGALDLLQVIDVFDLRVRAEPVVVPAEVRLAVGEKDRLVLRAPKSRDGEVPPLREDERANEQDDSDRTVAQPRPTGDEPPPDAPADANEVLQRVGLGAGVTVRAGVAGGAVAAGISPALKRLIAVTTSLSSRRFSMKRTCCCGMSIGSRGP